MTGIAKKGGKTVSRRRTGLLGLALLGAVVVLSSCASEMSTRSSHVYMLSALQVHRVEDECEFLANVQGSDYFWGGCCVAGFMQDVAYNNALNELLDQAAELGATHVFVNLGTGGGLRGQAYRCAYCVAEDGTPDTALCLGPDGKPDQGFCRDAKGNRVGGRARCKGAEGRDEAECTNNCGAWIPGMDQTLCTKQGHVWVPKALNENDCAARGGLWVLDATDRLTCEKKGGRWVINEDVILPIKEEKKKD